MDETKAPSVIVDEQSLIVNDSGNVFGHISIRVGDLAFPTDDWSDFVVVLLGWWARAVSELIDEEAREADLQFMEAPHIARIQTSPGGWRLVLVDGLSETPPDECQIDLVNLARSLLASAESVLARAGTDTWSTKDVETLRTEVRRLHAALARRPV